MDRPSNTQVALPAYFARIDFTGEPRADLATLRELHLAHATHIPFENIDPLLGRPARMDLASLQAKLIHARRGGYCFEQNTLFAAVLEQLGFAVTRLAARVHVNTNRVLPRTHKLLRVEAEGRSWVCDVGFGSWGLLLPLELRADHEMQQGDWTLRLTRAAEGFTLHCAQSPIGTALYSFTLEPQLPVDYEPANHYCSTHPRSRFVLTLTAQMAGLSERALLRNREFIISRATESVTQPIIDEAHLRQVLAERFGIALPPNTPSLLEIIDRHALLAL